MTEIDYSINNRLVNKLGEKIDEMYDHYEVKYVTYWGESRTYQGTVIDLICYILPSDIILSVRNVNA